jgi:predicted transposase/invertase (TIGR01784 family)
MKPVNNIHDNLFRYAMSHRDVAADFLFHYLPTDLTANLRLETLTIAKDTFVDPGQREHYSDLLYTVFLKEDTSAFVYFLFEHKSRPDRFVALQVLRYMVEIWELHRKQNKQAKTLPLIIPIVVYHGKNSQKAARLADLIDLPTMKYNAYVPHFDLAFYDFSPASDEKIKGAITLRLMLACFRAKNNPRTVGHVLEIFGLLGKLDNSETSMRWIEVIATYMFQTMDIDRNVMHNIATLQLDASKEDTIMTLAERLRKEGRMEGRMEGKLEGKLEGEVLGRHAMLQRQLGKRFGKDILDIRMQERLRTASAEQLDLWAERILDARTLEDVFRE